MNLVLLVFPVLQASAVSQDISVAYIIHGGKMNAAQQDTHVQMASYAGYVTNHTQHVSWHVYLL